MQQERNCGSVLNLYKKTTDQYSDIWDRVRNTIVNYEADLQILEGKHKSHSEDLVFAFEHLIS